MIIIDCEKIQDMLTEYINRSLPESENIAVISHLAVCKHCREQAALVIKIKKLTETAETEVPFEILNAAFEKIPYDETPLDAIINSGSVFMAFDIIRYVLTASKQTIKFACQQSVLQI
ncbi:MAG: zf-HC2 domain-containing protein [Eubacteriales bacterium]